MSAMPNDDIDSTEARPDVDVPDRDVPDRDNADEAVVAGTPVVVRRHAGIAALIGAAASAVAIAYLWRASQTTTFLDWTLCGVMAVIAAYYLVSLVDARTPLLVADDLGVRIRLGDEWRGLPWDAIGQVVVHPRKGLLRDGRLVFQPRSLARALEGLDAKGRRHAALNQKMYGAALAVPVGTTTRVSTAGERTVAEEIEALALGRAEVVELDATPLEVTEPKTRGGAEPERGETPAEGVPADETTAGATRETPAAHDLTEQAAPRRREVFPRIHAGEPAAATEWQAEDAATADGTASGVATAPALGEATESMVVADDEPERTVARAPRRNILGGIGTIVSRVAKGRSHDLDAGAAEQNEPHADGAEPAQTPTAAPKPLAPTAALRETRPGLRAEATLNLPPTAGSAALDPSVAGEETRTGLPEGRELRRPGSVDLVFEKVQAGERVRPISTLGDPVEPLVIDDFVTEPAYDPVIGPELAAARTRLGLSVDDLAERTRIRPHVIESIEVDDFAPCGGDFYARGHLRTLARILGKDAGPLLEKFEERYATAPINARRVFEAELATGMTGSMRSTLGGPSWGLMVGVVLCLVLVWGVLRLFVSDPAEMQAPVIHGSASVDSGAHGQLRPLAGV